MKIPNFNWITFDKDNPPTDLFSYRAYLILLREDIYYDGSTFRYSVDKATPYGISLGNFWNTEDDWCDDKYIDVLAYAEIPYSVEEKDLIDTESVVGCRKNSLCDDFKRKGE